MEFLSSVGNVSLKDPLERGRPAGRAELCSPLSRRSSVVASLGSATDTCRAEPTVLASPTSANTQQSSLHQGGIFAFQPGLPSYRLEGSLEVRPCGFLVRHGTRSLYHPWRRVPCIPLSYPETPETRFNIRLDVVRSLDLRTIKILGVDGHRADSVTWVVGLAVLGEYFVCNLQISLIPEFLTKRRTTALFPSVNIGELTPSRMFDL